MRLSVTMSSQSIRRKIILFALLSLLLVIILIVIYNFNDLNNLRQLTRLRSVKPSAQRHLFDWNNVFSFSGIDLDNSDAVINEKEVDIQVHTSFAWLLA